MLSSAVRAGSIILVALAGLAGIVMANSVLLGGVSWLAFLFFVMSGWGYFAVRALRVPDPDFGLRAVWGIGAFLAVAGVLLALDACNAPALQGLVGIGFAGFAWRELAAPKPLLASIASTVPFIRENPKRLFIGIIVALAIFQLVGGVAKLGGNVWDDDIAYTAFLRRLLDIGNMDEPFSFRRLSAYGGQVVLNATAAVRGNMRNVFLIDHGLCQGLMILLVYGYARAKKLDGVWQALLILVLLLLPNTSINTASYYSGVAGFLGLYRTVILLGEARDPQLERRYIAISGLLGAGVCTLRQNYIPVVVFFLGFVLIARLWKRTKDEGLRTSWIAERHLWLVLVATTAAALLPYCIAAYQSNKSFLFPLMPGTWNHGLQLTPYVWSWLQELEFLVWCCVEPHGIIVIVPLFCVLIFLKDERSGSPITSLFIANCLAFLILAHTFTSSDPLNLWRYAFGYVVTLTAMLAIEIAPSKHNPRTIKLGWLPRWVVLASLLFQVLESRVELRWRYRTMVVDLRAAIAADKTPGKVGRVEQLYKELQHAIPEGARMMTMLDYAGYLDFSRNDVLLIDMPGWCAWGRYPSFEGPAATKAYFLEHGIRYVAFVRPDDSAALYRRDGWMQRLYQDNEVSRIMAAYLVDTIDTMAALSYSHQILFEKEGMVVIDLEAPR
ncbi:MAG: hypothetical protein SFX73_30000 [Kofleriaceae bacterium]|nr:hypothetical protein [Kofleriaceae bacterium]